MKYEFTFFDNIVATKPNPILHNQEPKEYYLNYLTNQFQNIFGIHTITLNKRKNKYTIHSSSFETTLHRFADDSYLVQESLFDQHEEPAVEFALNSLGIKVDTVLSSNTTFCSDKIYVHIKVHHSFEKLTDPEAKYFYYFYNLKSEIDRIKATIKESVFAFKNEHETEHFVQKCQNEIESLCFQLLRLFPDGFKKCIYKKPKDFSNEEILHFVMVSLENMALFIEQYYFNFINKKACIPYRSELLNHPNLKDKITFVSSVFLLSKLHPDLLLILQNYLDRFRVFNLNEKISYEELKYFNLFIDEFYLRIKSPIVADENMIIDILVQLNFNSLELFNYKTDKIYSEIENIQDPKEKVDKLLYYSKLYNQNPIKSQIAFDQGLPAINVQVTNWLEEENNYLLKQNSFEQLKQTDITSDKKSISKINTVLSVGQLSYLFKLMMDTGIINHPNQKDLFRFISDNFQTSKANNISISSINSKYYVVDETTKESLKALLIEMINEINRKD